MPTMKTVTCHNCKDEFEVELKRFNNYNEHDWNFYCSDNCRTTNQKTGQFYECHTCKKQIWKTPSTIARSKTGNVYCSKHCATISNNTLFKSGKNNPNFIDGIRSYRERALSKYPNECNICGYKEEPKILEVHHIDGNRKNNNITNLQILCPNCHRKFTLDLV